MNLTVVNYKIFYENKNITKDVSDYLLSLSYQDKAAGESDEIELKLHDKDLLWQNDWYPDKGAKLTVEIEDKGQVLKCGTFTIDEISVSFDRAGDVVHIRGLAAGITKSLRSKKSSAHENKTLKELAQTIADNHGLILKGKIEQVTISRVTQNRESDLALLKRISDKFGYAFTIRDNILLFTSNYELESKVHVYSLDKSEITSGSFNDVSKEVFTEVRVRYHDPTKNKLIEKIYQRKDAIIANINAQKAAIKKIAVEAKNQKEKDTAGDIGGFFGIFSEDDPGERREQSTIKYFAGYDVLNKYETVDNEQQAEAIAKAALHKSITREKTCQIRCPGNSLLISGVNVELKGFGQLSGIYHILESTHYLDRDSGYETSFEAKRVEATAPKRFRPGNESNKIDKTNPAALEFYKQVQRFNREKIIALKKIGYLKEEDEF